MTAHIDAPVIRTQRILRISRVVSNLDVAVQFYCGALGFRSVRERPVDASLFQALGASGGADEVVLRLGQEEIALIRFDTTGRSYPRDSRSNDLWFQHLAIVVADMDVAYGQLCAVPGSAAISVGGPQVLPPDDGSVRAFKFRDPDGHPLELIWFPPGQGREVWHRQPGDALFMGIDHSAFSIASTQISLDFYQTLGFSVSDSSLNRGPAQSLLDDLNDAQVAVTGLRPASMTGPGLELLEYQPPGRAAEATSPNDLLTDWVTLGVPSASGNAPYERRDPDGHRFLIVDRNPV